MPNRQLDRPWMVLRRGNEVTERWLSQQLSAYGIRPRTVWIGKTSAKGYMQGEFSEVFSGYITKAAMLAFVAEADEARRQMGVVREGMED